MKKQFLALPLLAATMMFAQGPRGFGRAAGSTTPPSPAQIAQRDTNRLTRFLGLSSSQQNAVLGILTNAYTNLQTNQAAIQADRTALIAAVKGNDAAGISAALTPAAPGATPSLLQLQGQQQIIQLDAAASIYQLLDPTTQQPKVRDVMTLFGGGFGFRGMRPMGPPPGGAPTTP